MKKAVFFILLMVSSSLLLAERAIGYNVSNLLTINSLDMPYNLSAQAGHVVVHLNWSEPAGREILRAPKRSMAENGEKLRSSKKDNILRDSSAERFSDVSLRTLAGYNVYRNGTLIHTTSAGESYYSDTGVVSGVTYQYYVTALYSIGESFASDTVEATPLAPIYPPHSLSATADDNMVSLEWEAPEPPSVLRVAGSTQRSVQYSQSDNRQELLGYNVYRDGDQINIQLVDHTCYEDTTVVNGVTYNYYVTALYDTGESESSNIAFVFVPIIPDPPINVEVSIVDEFITISWGEGENANYYIVYSSAEPDGIFEEDLTGTFDSTSWTAPVTDERRFYYVTAVASLEADGFEWCLIPAGDYTYGQNNDILNIDYDYEIMKYEVTNAQYLAYLQEAYAAGDIWVSGSEVQGYYPGDQHWGPGNLPFYQLGIPSSYNFAQISYSNGEFTLNTPSGFTVDDYLNHPVVRVSWFGAWHFADYYGWRLPTEHEWEKAARGMTGFIYPWGDDIDGSRANYLNSGDPWDNGTSPVGFYNGQTYQDFQTSDMQSPFGVYDMVGNVFNWTDSFWSSTSSNRVVRGGSWPLPQLPAIVVPLPRLSDRHQRL
jgi:formylglycine-generating enzyme required for sulfatase activity